MARSPREQLDSLVNRVKILLGNRRAADAVRVVDGWREEGEALAPELGLVFVEALLVAGDPERAAATGEEIAGGGIDIHHRYKLARVSQKGEARSPALRHLRAVVAEDAGYADAADRIAALTRKETTSPGDSLDPLSITRSLSKRFKGMSVIGRGGMGLVFRARDSVRGRDVAVKVLSPMICDDTQALERFLREAEILSQFDHPNVVKVFDADELPFPHYSMELVRGRSLAARIKEEGALPVPEVLRVAEGVLAGLVCVHQRGVLHRDVKPENILLTEAGVPRLTDFGLAADQAISSITQMGAIMGTLGYMSPEQLRGERPDPRGDLFSLGAVLFEALTGRGAFTGRRVPDGVGLERTAVGRLSEVLERRVPMGLVVLVELMMEEEPGHRVQTSAEALAMVRTLRWQAMGKGPMQLLREVRSLRTRVVTLLSGTFRRVATLPGEEQARWFEEAANLRDLRLLVWSLSEQLDRIRRLAAAREEDGPSWSGDADRLLGDLARFLGEPEAVAVDGFALRLRRLERDLARDLTPYQISLTDAIFLPLRDRCASRARGRVDVGVPEISPTVFGGPVAAEVVRLLAEAFDDLLDAAAVNAVLLKTRVQAREERWVLAVEGPGIERGHAEGARAFARVGGEAEPVELGAFRVSFPVVMTPEEPAATPGFDGVVT